MTAKNDTNLTNLTNYRLFSIGYFQIVWGKKSDKSDVLSDFQSVLSRFSERWEAKEGRFSYILGILRTMRTQEGTI